LAGGGGMTEATDDEILAREARPIAAVPPSIFFTKSRRLFEKTLSIRIRFVEGAKIQKISYPASLAETRIKINFVLTITKIILTNLHTI
jgi:hypothetical protein